MDAEHTDKLTDIVRDDVDWADVFALAELHGLLPLLHLHVSRHAAVAPAIRERLSRAAQPNAQRNLFLTARLLKVLTALEANDIVAMAFKGPMLAARAYGNIAYRQFEDLDLFVRPSQLVAAREVLTELGYTSQLPLSDSGRRTFFRTENQLMMCHGDVIVELHWAVERRAFAVHVDLERIWRRAERVCIAGHELAHPSPEDLMVLLCIHGTKHEWRRIGWIADIAELLRANPRIAWDDVLAFAAEAGVARMVRLGVLLATDVLDAVIPPAIDRWARGDVRALALSYQIRQRFYVDRGSLPEMLYRTRFHIATRERWRDKFRRAWRQTVTPAPADWSSVPLPPQLIVLYSILRPLRIVAKRSAQALTGFILRLRQATRAFRGRRAASPRA